MSRKYPQLCPECAAPVTGKAKYCSPAHKQAFNNRLLKMGKELTPLLLGWRAGRGSGPIPKAAFAAMIQLADKFNSELREDGCPPMLAFVESRGWYGRNPDAKGDLPFNIDINVNRSVRRPRKAKAAE